MFLYYLFSRCTCSFILPVYILWVYVIDEAPVLTLMFKKPLNNLKTSAPLSGSDRRRFKQRVIAAFAISPEEGDHLVPEGIQSVKFTTHLDEQGVSPRLSLTSP